MSPSSRRSPLPRVDGFRAELLNEGPARRPVVFGGAASAWPAASTFTPEFFRTTFGELTVQPTMLLPERGAPYESTEALHRREMKLGAFVDAIERGERCYLDQMEIGRFEGLGDALGLDAMVEDPQRIVNLWIGAKTRSGLHYDGADNLLIQLHGVKRATLVSPADAGRVYPFGDNVDKSRVDPDAPDLHAFPSFAKATVWSGELAPGDVLFIPRGWWHHLSTTGPSVSVNCWYGPFLSVGQRVRYVMAASPTLWLKIGRDFVWNGLLGQPYTRRLYSAPPTGKQLYDLVAAGLRGARPHREKAPAEP